MLCALPGALRTSSAMGSYAPQTPCALCAAKHPLCVCPAPQSLLSPSLKGGVPHIRLVEETKKWVLSSERKAPKKEREYAAARLDGVITKIKNAMQGALAKIQRTLMQPEMKQAGKEQIKAKARESIKDKIARAKVRADRDNRERWEREGRIAPAKKKDMEL